MPRIREIEEAGGDPVLAEVFQREQETFGFVLNTTKVQAHCPGSKFNAALGIEAQGFCVLES